jgi:tRNA pseudouridine38-40 synthase
MRTLKLTIAYDGTRYAGWQAQAGPQAADGGPPASQRPTIQGALERVLRTVLQERVMVVGSGRTDAGVHAEGQVAHVRTRSAMPARRLLRSVNQLLPADLAVLRIEEAPEGFHARFDARRKRYRYRLFTGPVVPPFIRPYVHHVRAPLNVPLMRREAAALRGRHDFRAFARASSWRRTGSRTVTAVALRRKGPELHLEVEGNGFLHTMVRSIAGTLIDVGRGRLAPGTARRMLRTGERRLAGTTAPAKGLSLVDVRYPGDGG